MLFGQYAKGKCYDSFKQSDGYRLEWQAGAFTLYCILNGITKEEISEFNVTKKFEVFLSVIEDVGFFSFNFGNFLSGEAPFIPCLYDVFLIDDETIENIKNTNKQGFALNVVVADGTTGKLEDIRIIGLGNEFSKNVLNWLFSSKKITKDDYNTIVDDVLSKYSTKEIQDLAVTNWKLPKGSEKTLKEFEKNKLELE